MLGLRLILQFGGSGRVRSDLGAAGYCREMHIKSSIYVTSMYQIPCNVLTHISRNGHIYPWTYFYQPLALPCHNSLEQMNPLVYPSSDLIVSTALLALSLTSPSVASPPSASALSLQNCHLFSLNPDSPSFSLNSVPGLRTLWSASSSVCALLPLSWSALPACLVHS